MYAYSPVFFSFWSHEKTRWNQKWKVHNACRINVLLLFFILLSLFRGRKSETQTNRGIVAPMLRRSSVYTCKNNNNCWSSSDLRCIGLILYIHLDVLTAHASVSYYKRLFVWVSSVLFSLFSVFLSFFSRVVVARKTVYNIIPMHSFRHWYWIRAKDSFFPSLSLLLFFHLCLTLSVCLFLASNLMAWSVYRNRFWAFCFASTFFWPNTICFTETVDMKWMWQSKKEEWM